MENTSHEDSNPCFLHCTKNEVFLNGKLLFLCVVLYLTDDSFPVEEIVLYTQRSPLKQRLLILELGPRKWLLLGFTE